MSTSIENRVWNDILLAVEKRLNRQSLMVGKDDDLDDVELKAENSPNSSKNGSSSLFSLLEAAQSDGLTPGATTFVDIEPLENPLNPKCSFQTFVVGSC